jgi:K+-transporting ATPase ATPase B chain
MKHQSQINRKMILEATLLSFKKLDPRVQIKNLIMFCVFLGAIVGTVVTIKQTNSFHIQITLWLWFTVLFANFAEALAEGKGKAQTDALKKTRKDSIAKKLFRDTIKEISAKDLRKGDRVVCEAGDIIPGDGEVIEGIASVDESAITGESAPVIREAGGDRSAVTGGTKVLSDRIVIKITTEPGNTFLDRMIQMVEGANRKPTPNEIALNILLISLTLIFILAVLSLKAFVTYTEQASGLLSPTASVLVLIALFVCLIPTTISGLLSAIGISGINRLAQKNVMAMSGKAVEASGDIDVLLLDKTGTITLGNREASEFKPVAGVSAEKLAQVSQLSSLTDTTPEGRSIVVLAKDKFNLRAKELNVQTAKMIPFSAETRLSGVDIKEDGKTLCLRKGAVEAVRNFVTARGGVFPEEAAQIAHDFSKYGATPLAVCEDDKVLGIIVLKDTVKGGIRERFAELRKMGIRTVMITGDNPLTAASIAAEAGVDDFIAEATPETKLVRIREEQAKGHLVGMIGDGTNDAPALAQADVGVAMNTGTQAAREAGNMIDLDSNPTKLIEIVETGKQLLMTRGALTTFSIANDVAKYFAILPAMFAGFYAVNGAPGPLASLDIMGLSSPESAILSAVIFNALIIVVLIPLALKGVRYRPLGASVILQRNLFVYGLGGVISPFIGIKVIDLILHVLHAV